MAGTSRLKKALAVISSYFEDSPRKVFNRREIAELFSKMRMEWNLPDSLSSKGFTDQLVKHSVLKTIDIESEGNPLYTRPKLERYAYGDVSPFQVALSIRANTHLSHYSSMFLLGLTEQIPKNIYVTFEQSERHDNRSSYNLDQKLIDQAFASTQKEPSSYYIYLDYKITLLSSKFSKNSGVINLSTIFGRNLSITNIERTLIDITVRPAYSGGVAEVLKAYERAAENASINKLISILSKLDYIYPYHQAIGFYLENSGKYRSKQIDLIRHIEKKYDFYLTYNMKNKKYSTQWRLFYPAHL